MNTLTTRLFTPIVLVGSAVLALSAVWLLAVPTAQAVTSPTSVQFEVEKKFSGPVPAGYTADQFTFTITGPGVSETVSLTAHTDDSANGSVELTAGTYTITENGPAGFVPAQWTVKWDGAGCTGVTADSTTIEIDASDYGKTNFGCRADNQWRHGTVRVDKVVVGTSTPFETFSFTATDDNGEVYSGPFNSSGRNEITVAAGSYSIVEAAAPGYTATYSAGCSGTIDNSETISCIITNTPDTVPVEVLGCTDTAADNYDPAATTDDGSCTYPTSDVLGCTDPSATNYDPLATLDDGSCNYGGGGGNPEEPTYLVFGYVWHDENNNEEWEGFNNEDAENREDDLSGWVVTITNGSTTDSTVTDEEGYYEFYVPAGSWTISEEVQDDWVRTFPDDGTHVVVVENDDDSAELNEENELLTMIKQLFVPAVARAQSATTYGPFNFGNFFTGGGSGGDPGGGGSSSPRCEFDYAVAGSDVVLTWETKFANEMIITQNGTEIVNTSVDLDGTLTVGVTEATEFILTASRGSRDRTCTLSVPFGTGSGGGTPDDAPAGIVLGEQVSVVPVGAPATGGGGAPQSLPYPAPAFLTAAFVRRNND